MTAQLHTVGLGALTEAQQLLGAAGAVAPVAAEVLPGLTSYLDAAATLLPAVIDFVRTGWEGAAALGADHSLSTVGVSLAELGSSAAEIASITVTASHIVLRGAVEIAGIIQGFTASAAGVLPTALTPAGQVALLGLAADALGRAMAVVERVRGELSGPTARLWQIAAETAATPAAALEVPDLHGAASLKTEAALFGDGTLRTQASALPLDPDTGNNANVETHAASDCGLADCRESGTSAVVLPSGETAVAPNPQAAAAVEAALSQQGVGYVWGGQAPGQGFDCSGLTQWAYREAGVDIPRTSQEQDIGRQLSREELAPGDLVVWEGHVAMYIGAGQMVEAGDPVGVSPLRTDNIGMEFRGFYRPTEQR